MPQTHVVRWVALHASTVIPERGGLRRNDPYHFHARLPKGSNVFIDPPGTMFRKGRQRFADPVERHVADNFSHD